MTNSIPPGISGVGALPGADPGLEPQPAQFEANLAEQRDAIETVRPPRIAGPDARTQTLGMVQSLSDRQIANQRAALSGDFASATETSAVSVTNGDPNKASTEPHLDHNERFSQLMKVQLEAHNANQTTKLIASGAKAFHSSIKTLMTSG